MDSLFFFQEQELDNDNKILCCYTNNSINVVILRKPIIPGRYCERVVFPGERFLFIASKDSQIEVHKYNAHIGLVKETILCTKLAIEKSANAVSASYL